MKKRITICFILFIITMFSVCIAEGAEEYSLPGQSEWTLWDNPRTTNDGTPFVILPGERVTIVDIQGCGVIRKLWMSMNYVGKALYPRARERNSQVWIECFWDGADQPAISAPVGDFFGHIMGRDQPNILTATLDDYCGSSWDYDRVYHHQDSGLLFSEYFQEGGGEHAIYCYHRRDPLYFQESCSVTYRSCQGAPVTEFLEWYSTDEDRLKAIECNQSLDDIRRFIAEGGGKSFDYVEFYTNDDLYSVAYYYLDRP